MFILLGDKQRTLLTEMVQSVAMFVRQYCCSPAEAVDCGDVRELKFYFNNNGNFNINPDFANMSGINKTDGKSSLVGPPVR